MAGDLDQQLAMEVLSYLEHEQSTIVWDSVMSGFGLFKIEGAACNMTKHIYWEWEVQQSIIILINVIKKSKLVLNSSFLLMFFVY